MRVFSVSLFCTGQTVIKLRPKLLEIQNKELKDAKYYILREKPLLHTKNHVNPDYSYSIVLKHVSLLG